MCAISAVFPNWRSSTGSNRPEKLNQPLTRLNFSLTPCQSYYSRHHRRLRVLSPNACARVNDAPCGSRPARRDFFRRNYPLCAVSLTRCSNRGDSALGVALTPNPSPSSRRGEYGVRKRSFRPTLKLTLQHSKSGGSMECGSEASACR